MASVTPPAPATDPSAAVSKAAQSALQSLALLFDEVNQQAPDSPIAGAVQDLMRATSEVKRHITSVGPDLQEGTPDDIAPQANPAEGMPPEPDMGAEPVGAEPPMMEDEAPVDPGPMGPGPFNAAGRGMNQALLDAAKRRQP